MMPRCSSNHAVGGGACTCGSTVFHTQTNNSSSFSMLFSMSNHTVPFDYEYSHEMYPFTPPSSYSSVDCTLSLGTPSTRRTDHHHKREVVLPDHHRRSSFCWDILQNKRASSPPQPHRNSSAGGGGGGDPLVARRCANCDTTSTPLWRNGPRGPKSLCNACGIRYKKEERRATASGPHGGGAGGAASGLMEPQQHMINNSWVPQYSQSQRVPCYSPATAAGNEFRFIDGCDDSDSGIPFLSWRLNVADRAGLVHDFTR